MGPQNESGAHHRSDRASCRALIALGLTNPCGHSLEGRGYLGFAVNDGVCLGDLSSGV